MKTPQRDTAGRFSKRSPAGQELQPPGNASPSADPKKQLGSYQERMAEAYYRAFPAVGQSTASRLRALHGQKRVRDFNPTPKRRT